MKNCKDNYKDNINNQIKVQQKMCTIIPIFKYKTFIMCSEKNPVIFIFLRPFDTNNINDKSLF